MSVDDPESYSINTHGSNTGNQFSSLFGNASQMVWNYGKEVFCNMEGQYMHIVADLSHMAGQSYTMSICALGIMGTRYIRNVALPEEIEVAPGSAVGFDVE